MPAAAKVSRHDSSPAATPRDQTDPKKLETAIAAAEHARAAKGGPAQASPNEVPYQVHSGDTIWRVAQNHGDKLSDVIKANPQIANPDRIKDGDILFVPTKDPATVATRQKVADAEAADRSVAGLETDLRNPKLSGGMRRMLNEELTAARSDASTKWTAVHTSVENELRNAGVGKGLPDTTTDSLVADIRTRVPDSEKFQKTVDAALQTVRTQAQTDRQVQDIVTKAQGQSDPLAALRSLNDGFKSAPQDVKDALLRDPNALKIIDGTVTWANQPLQQPGNAIQPQGQTYAALQRLDQATRGLDKTLAGVVADRALPGYEKFRQDNQNYLPGGSPFGFSGIGTLVNIGGRIAGTPQGNDAVARFSAMHGWHNDAVRNAISAGADPAYAIVMAQQVKARGIDPSMVVQTITDGIAMRDGDKIANGGSVAATIDVANRLQAAGLDGSGVMKVATDGVQRFKDKVTDDVKKLAQHDAELAWLVQNDGAGLTPQQLNQAVADYRQRKGAGWQADEAKLRQQIADDGTRLLDQMRALNQLPPSLSGSQAAADQTLKTIANDPAAGLAIDAAIQSNPELADVRHAKEWADIFAFSKVGDVGRKYTNEFASAQLRRNVLQKLQGLDLKDPASVAQAKQAISSLSDENFARLAGVAKSDLDKALKEVQATADKIAGAGSQDEVDAALRDLDKKLNTDAALSKTFNKMTRPGQLLRGVAVAFAGASLINSYSKFNANPSDPQNGIKLLLDAAGFAQKNSELLVGLGAVNKKSAIGQFGGEWKLLGRASAGDLIAGVSAVLDGVSAVRSEFGLGVPQDTGNAVFSATTAVGGALTVAPAFGAAAWLGPVGLGVTAAGVIGKAIYEQVKDAHKYEGASKNFLKAAGYNDAASDALSKQGGLVSGAKGAAQMPFLAKYAELKHLRPDQLVNWVNGLSADQVKHLSERLLQTAGDSNGDAGQFTNGPPQKGDITDPSTGYTTQVTLANTVGVFDDYLNYDHVPHP